jgi:hypothetical protein
LTARGENYSVYNNEGKEEKEEEKEGGNEMRK